MKLLLDEMHAPAAAEALVAQSFDVAAVASRPDLRGMADEDLLDHAAVEGRAVVTENAADFMALVTRAASEGQEHGGLILTNPKRFNRAALAYPGDLIAALRQFLDDPPVEGDSWIWWL